MQTQIPISLFLTKAWAPPTCHALLISQNVWVEKFIRTRLTPKASPHLATPNDFPTKVFDRCSFSISLFKLLTHRADRLTHLWQATVSFCFFLSLMGIGMRLVNIHVCVSTSPCCSVCCTWHRCLEARIEPFDRILHSGCRHLLL